jgi:secondary thiamine-phosphate synthase enzyme
MQTISINSRRKDELIDITADVARIVAESGVAEGVCFLNSLHTTAGLVVNENADPDVKRDIVGALGDLLDSGHRYEHGEGNSPAHIKASLVGVSKTLPVSGGRLVLGTWQGIFFAEFDGPRHGRRVAVTVLSAR